MIDVPVLVKDSLRDGRRKKNYRILVLNDDGTTDFVIDNNTLVSEQADIDERMCSGDTIKFGLCEGSSFQFQYFDHPNITGRQIQVFIDAQYIGTGYENVQKFQRYRFITLEEGGNYRAYSANANGFSKLYLLRNGSTQQFTPTSTDTETYVEFSGMVGDMLEVEWTQFPLYDTYLQKQNSNMILEYPIPMGFFTVKNCSRQASTGIMKVTAYNKLQSDYLDQKANNILVDEFDDPTREVTIFDIRNLLLNNYEIENDDYRQIEIAKQSTWWWNVRLLSGGSISLRAKYGINNPFNYYMYNSADLTTYTSGYLYASEYQSKVILDPNQVYKIKGTFELELLEQHYFNEIQSLMSDAFSGFTMSRFINPGTASTMPYSGWHNLFCIRIIKGTTTEIYSTIGYNNNLSGVTGTLSDLEKTSIINATKIEFCIPWKLEFNISNNGDASNRNIRVNLEGENRYIYYSDSSMDYDSEAHDTYTYTDPNGDEVTDISSYDWVDAYEYENIADADKIAIVPSDLQDFTLRDITSAVYETLCQFGKLDRVTDLFSGVELNHSRLFPADTVYPSESLYPDGAASSTYKSMYSKLWADEGNVQKWRNLIITYKGLDENNQEKEFTLQRQINADGTQDYNMSDNWLFKQLVWTAEAVGEYADEMVSKMRDMTWFPFEMWCAGLPYIETGDEIEISINQQTYTSYILQRQLKGIQNLQDTFINGTLDIF